jgi:hypothetical protein
MEQEIVHLYRSERKPTDSVAGADRLPMSGLPVVSTTTPPLRIVLAMIPRCRACTADRPGDRRPFFFALGASGAVLRNLGHHGPGGLALVAGVHRRLLHF